MSISNNTTYNTVLTSAALLFLSTSFVHTDTLIKSSLPTSSYDKYINYNIEKQSTIDNSSIQNNLEMLKILEIDVFNKIINEKFNTSILETWLPANNILDKSCLFVAINNQEELTESYRDFELELYLALEEEINKSNFFDMIALI